MIVIYFIEFNRKYNDLRAHVKAKKTLESCVRANTVEEPATQAYLDKLNKKYVSWFETLNSKEVYRVDHKAFEKIGPIPGLNL